jgi:hypothetical protein
MGLTDKDIVALSGGHSLVLVLLCEVEAHPFIRNTVFNTEVLSLRERRTLKGLGLTVHGPVIL